MGFSVFTEFCKHVVVQSLSHVRLFVTPWREAHQASLSFTISWGLLKLMSIELVMLCYPLPPSSLFAFSLSPGSGSFPMSWLFASVGQSTGASASASVLQWIFRVDFLYDWLVWSPCCPQDSRESSLAPKFESINSSVLSLLDGPTLTSICDY